MILTKKDQIAFYFPLDLNKNKQNYKEIYFSLETLKKKNQYFINDVIIHFLNISEEIKENGNELAKNIAAETNNSSYAFNGIAENQSLSTTNNNKNYIDSNLNNEFIFKINKLPTGIAQQKGKLLIGDFLVYGDKIGSNLAVPKSGQIIHLNNKKITLRQGQPIFISPKSILHKYDGDFIDQQSPVITLSYQQLKTGDIIQGIPKVEQFFEARTTKRGRLFHDSLANLLKGLFKRYYSKLPLDQAVRQSFYKIQQIIVDGVQRVYRSQGVSIADKHLEVIVKQMTSKVRIIEGGQTGFFPGEVVDLEFVEQVNSLLMKKISYEPLVLGITKSSLEVDSFLSAASFQQTTRVLSKAAISRKKDFLKGLKENVILGNLIPAGTGYLVYLDQI
jgi:DNA-directed RNA polymerase subunit beta'